MTTSPHRGFKPEWANLPRRRCANCGKSYKPKQPLRKGQEYGFCAPNCKYQFHRHGGAYTKLKGEISKEIAKQFRETVREIVREELKAARIYDAEARECEVVL